MDLPQRKSVKINNIEFEFLPEHYELKLKGTVYIAQCYGEYYISDIVESLVGKEIYGKTVIAVETFAINFQTNPKIGILFEKKE
jgi:hypothetical protein